MGARVRACVRACVHAVCMRSVRVCVCVCVCWWVWEGGWVGGCMGGCGCVRYSVCVRCLCLYTAEYVLVLTLMSIGTTGNMRMYFHTRL